MATSWPHNWFSLAEGAGWGRRLPRQIFLTTWKDTHMVRNAVPRCAGCACLAWLGPVVPGPTSPQGWLRCECLAEIPLWAKTSVQCSQASSGRNSPSPTGNSLSEQGNPALGKAGLPALGLLLELGPRCSGVLVWRWLQPPPASAFQMKISKHSGSSSGRRRRRRRKGSKR